MRKKTPTTVGLAIATILTAYISGLTLSNQTFAQVHIGMHGLNITLIVGEYRN
jgi:hypothetical protein